MEFIRTFREKSHTKRQEEIHKMAEETICLSDFADSIYIAYEGTPLIPVQADWTSRDIIQELSKVRQNFINSHLKQEGLA